MPSFPFYFIFDLSFFHSAGNYIASFYVLPMYINKISVWGSHCGLCGWIFFFRRKVRSFDVGCRRHPKYIFFVVVFFSRVVMMVLYLLALLLLLHSKIVCFWYNKGNRFRNYYYIKWKPNKNIKDNYKWVFLRFFFLFFFEKAILWFSYVSSSTSFGCCVLSFFPRKLLGPKNEYFSAIEGEKMKGNCRLPLHEFSWL